jgi:hypothetical protein
MIEKHRIEASTLLPTDPKTGVREPLKELRTRERLPH